MGNVTELLCGRYCEIHLPPPIHDECPCLQREMTYFVRAGRFKTDRYQMSSRKSNVGEQL